MINQILYDGVSLPPDTESFLNRPHINNILKEAIQKPLTTVIASAGFGKTQAVSTLLGSTDKNIIWLQLSELDNLISRLWERFAYAFEPHNKNLSKSLISLGYPDSMASFDQFLRLIAKELLFKKRFVIVLDDFHLIRNKPILNFFEKIIFAHIQNISIVLIARTKPDLSLAGMLSKGLLARITEEDLRFSKDEMVAYYKKQDLNLNDNMISNIYSQTEGWIFAIYLMGLSIKKGTVNKQNALSLAKIDIFELIDKEIFSISSKELQDLLIHISLLDIIPAGLLKELAHSNYSIMSEMTEISLFVRYDSYTDSYRIHRLFKDFLLKRKNKLTHDEIMEVHLIAAKWNQNNHHQIEAVDHYKQCSCYNEIFDIILTVNQHVQKDIAESFISLIEQAPKEIIEARPIMLVVRANYMFNNNRINEAQQELASIRKKYEALPKTKETQAILGEIYITLALISIVNQTYEFESLFKMADACLPDGSALISKQFNIADGINVFGIKNPIPGELQKYQDALFNAAPYASRVMNGCSHGMEFLNAAESYLYTGDIRNAEKYAYEAIYRAGQHQQYDIEYMANFVLVRIYVSKGDYTKTTIILKQMKDQLERLQLSEYISLYDVIEGWFYVKIGETNKVSKWIMREEETRKMLAPVILGREYLVHSDCMLADERYYELLAFMEHTDILYESRGILLAVIQNKITKAIIHHYMGNHQESMDALNEAYALSHPNDLTIQYIEYGCKMHTLINAANQDKSCKIPQKWLDNIYTKSSTYAKQITQITAEYNAANRPGIEGQIHLTKRELEILSYLCRGLTREEIAVSLYLSVNTVKSTLQNIYNKLGASNSIDAVRIATMLNINKAIVH